MLMRHSATQSRQAVNSKLYNTNIDQAMNRFEHFERKIESMEGEIEASVIGKKGIAAEFEALEKDGKIEQELAALKSKLERK
jgi:phage shock protein A